MCVCLMASAKIKWVFCSGNNSESRWNVKMCSRIHVISYVLLIFTLFKRLLSPLFSIP